MSRPQLLLVLLSDAYSLLSALCFSCFSVSLCQKNYRYI